MAKYVYNGPEGSFVPGATYDLAHAPTSPDWKLVDTPPQDPPIPPADSVPEETP